MQILPGKLLQRIQNLLRLFGRHIIGIDSVQCLDQRMFGRCLEQPHLRRGYFIVLAGVLLQIK